MVLGGENEKPDRCRRMGCEPVGTRDCRTRRVRTGHARASDTERCSREFRSQPAAAGRSGAAAHRAGRGRSGEPGTGPAGKPCRSTRAIHSGPAGSSPGTRSTSRARPAGGSPGTGDPSLCGCAAHAARDGGAGGPTGRHGTASTRDDACPARKCRCGSRSASVECRDSTGSNACPGRAGSAPGARAREYLSGAHRLPTPACGSTGCSSSGATPTAERAGRPSGGASGTRRPSRGASGRIRPARVEQCGGRGPEGRRDACAGRPGCVGPAGCLGPERADSAGPNLCVGRQAPARQPSGGRGARAGQRHRGLPRRRPEGPPRRRRHATGAHRPRGAEARTAAAGCPAALSGLRLLPAPEAGGDLKVGDDRLEWPAVLPVGFGDRADR